MSNIEDVDNMGIWVTTLSNGPPVFEAKNGADKILKLCEDAGSELEEDAKKGAKEMMSNMWLQLQKEFQKAIDHHDKLHMTKNDVDKFVNDFFNKVIYRLFLDSLLNNNILIFSSIWIP